MALTTQLIFPNSGTKIDIIGDPIKANGWFGIDRPLHTFSVHLSNFTGRLLIDATLSVSPNENDWFSVLPENSPYYDYPKTIGGYGTTDVVGINVIGRFMFFKITMLRSHLVRPDITEDEMRFYGTIDKILLNQ